MPTTVLPIGIDGFGTHVDRTARETVTPSHEQDDVYTYVCTYLILSLMVLLCLETGFGGKQKRGSNGIKVPWSRGKAGVRW